MDENLVSPEELSLEDKIAVLMAQLPQPVQNFLRSPERDRISLELTQKYSLHADQASTFEQAYIYMLLGVYTPEEFVQELHAAAITEPSIKGLTADINERVFKRLQNAERVNPTVVLPAPVPPPPTPRPTPPPVPLQVPVPTPVPTPPPVVTAAPSPKPFPSPPTVPSPFVPPPTSMSAMPVVPESAVRTMAHDMQETKEQPRPPEPRPSQPVTPARSFQTASIPTTLPKPIPPSPPIQAPVPTSPPAPKPVPPPPPNLPGQPPVFNTPPVSPPIPIVKQYTVDPYRETPE